jgi:NADPH-dependent ferric siderophore reductase
MRLPGFLGALAPRLAEVEEAVDLGACFRLIRLRGEALGDLPQLQAGQELGIKTEAGWRSPSRHYSGLEHDRPGGRLAFVAFLHGKGPASRRLAALAPGDRLEMWGWSGNFALFPEARAHLMVGDESTVGAFSAMARAARGKVSGVIEVDPGQTLAASAALARLGLGLEVVARAASGPGPALAAWLEHAPLVPGGAVYLAGRGQSIVKVRAVARARGVADREIRVRTFWVDGHTIT